MTTLNVQSKLEKKLAEVKKAFVASFKSDNGEIVCSYCSTRFIPFPQHGNVTSNIGTHVNTDDHKNNVSKRKIQTSMSSFFNPKKRKTASDED